MILKAVTRYCG